MGAELIGAALVGGLGTILQNNAAEDAANKQKRIIAQADEATKKKAAQKSNLIDVFTSDTYLPENRLNSYQDAADSTNKSLTDALNADGVDKSIESASGNVSSDYVNGLASASANSAEDIIKRTRLLSNANAAGNMFTNEAQGQSQLNSDLSGINSEINNINRLSANRANSVDGNSTLAGLISGLAPIAGRLGKSKGV